MKLKLLSLISNQVTFQSTLVDRLGETGYDLAQFLNSESLEKSGCKIFKLYIHKNTAYFNVSYIFHVNKIIIIISIIISIIKYETCFSTIL